VGDEKRTSIDGLRDAVHGAWAGLVRTETIGRLRSAVRVQFSPIPGSATKKPANIIFGVEEEAPPSVIWISAVQHVGVIAIFMIYPLIVGRAAGASTDQLSSMLRMGMLALAIAVLLQALPRGPVGSRLLAPSIFTGVYLAPSQFEAGFISTAHSAADIERTTASALKVLKALLNKDEATVKAVVGELGIKDTGIRLVTPDDSKITSDVLIRFSDFKKDLDAKGLTSS
jgi:hypothetical protein